MLYVLALDQRSTCSRAVLFDEDGQPFAIAEQVLCEVLPHSGWSEHNATAIWTTQLAAAQAVVQQLKDLRGSAAVDAIAAIGIANQRGSMVAWDRSNGQPIGNAIVRHGGQTSLPLGSTANLRWLLDTVPEARWLVQQGRLACGTIDSWLIWNLTAGAVHVTDPGNASCTSMFNIHDSRWDGGLLSKYGVPESTLPRVVASSGVVATTDAALFGRSIPIAGIAGNQQAAALGLACFVPSIAKCTFEKDCHMLMNTGSQPVLNSSLLATVGWQRASDSKPSAYCLEGVVSIEGSIAPRLFDSPRTCATSSVVEPRIARSDVKAIALQVTDVFKTMSREVFGGVRELRVDGSPAQGNLLMQLLADLTGVAVVRPRFGEANALGSAFLAGIATGVWSDWRDLNSLWQVDRQFDPAFSEDRRLTTLARWHAAFEGSGRWAQ